MKISVIITAHDRKTFLREALSSVLKQSLALENYDIIIVKNYDDEPIADLIQANRERIKSVLVSASDTYGEMVARAVRISQADVIALLDDDDRWSLVKLETVARKFAGSSKLGLLHNGYVEIDQDGHSLRIGPRCDFLANGHRVTAATLDALGACNVFFNSSCITVRRDVVEAGMHMIKDLNEIDVLLPYLALSMGYGVASIPDVLTYYRVHMKKEVNLEKKGGIGPFLIKRYHQRLAHYNKVLEVVSSSEMFDRSARQMVARAFYRYRVLQDIISNASRLEKFRHSFELGKAALFGGHPARRHSEFNACMAGCLSVIFPGMAKNYLLGRVNRGLAERML